MGMLGVLRAKIENQDLTNIKTRLLDLEKGDLLEGNYHLIVCSMTLHHVREIKPLLISSIRLQLLTDIYALPIWTPMMVSSTEKMTPYSLGI